MICLLNFYLPVHPGVLTIRVAWSVQPNCFSVHASGQSSVRMQPLLTVEKNAG